jgi:hypothetical protein
MDAGGRATQGAVAERVRVRVFNWSRAGPFEAEGIAQSTLTPPSPTTGDGANVSQSLDNRCAASSNVASFLAKQKRKYGSDGGCA